MKSYKDLKEELLADPTIRRQYDSLGPEFAVIQLIIKERIRSGLSQKELAERIGTKQSAISRFESGSYNPTLSFLFKITEALGAKIEFTVR